ncbi:hypothetical protein EDB83DRAFT_2552280 [Lactarius deliciosus]|nr:hypothetical protein EDB83DRAFT_2552280 [Lactarius deliciosus]
MRKGCRRPHAAPPGFRLASLLPSAYTRGRAVTLFAPPLRCAHPSVRAQPAPPRLRRASPAHPLRAHGGPLHSPSALGLHRHPARRGLRLAAPTLLQACAGVAGRIISGPMAQPTQRGLVVGAKPPARPACEGRAARGVWEWAGIARTEGTGACRPSSYVRGQGRSGAGRGAGLASPALRGRGGAPSLLLRARAGAGRGAGRSTWAGLGWAGLASPALRGPGWRAVPPVACAGRGGAGRVGWAGVARAEETGMARRPFCCVRGQERGGARGLGWAGVARAKGTGVAHRPSCCVDWGARGPVLPARAVLPLECAGKAGARGPSHCGRGKACGAELAPPMLKGLGWARRAAPGVHGRVGELRIWWGGLTFWPPVCVEEGGVQRKGKGEKNGTSTLPFLSFPSSNPLHTAVLPTQTGDQKIVPLPAPVSPPSSRPPPPFAQTDAQEAQYAPAPLVPSARATPAQPPGFTHPARARPLPQKGPRTYPRPFNMGGASPAPRACPTLPASAMGRTARPGPACALKRRDRAPTPVPSARQPSPCAPPRPCPRTQQEGRCAHPGPFSAGDTSTPGPRASPCPCPRTAYATGGTARPSWSPQRGRRHPSPIHPAPPSPRMPGVHRQSPPRGLSHRPRVYAPRHARALPEEGVWPTSAPSMRGTLPQPPYLRAPPLPRIPGDAGGPLRPPQTRPSPRLSASHLRIPELQQGRRTQPPGLRAAPGGRYAQGGGPHAKGGTRNGGQCNPSADSKRRGVTPPPCARNGCAGEARRNLGGAGCARTEGWAHRSGGAKRVTARPRVYAEGRSEARRNPGGAACGRRHPFRIRAPVHRLRKIHVL